MTLDDTVQKPEDWPANDRECLLENIFTSVEEFKKNPNFQTKELLVSLVTKYDLNQTSSLGLHRNTMYEVSIINTLWYEATAINLNSMKVFLYEIVGETARHQKIVSNMVKTQDIIIDSYKYLCVPLRLYYFAYLQYVVDKNKPFSLQLIEVVKILLEKDGSFESIDFLTHAYVQILNDVSYFKNTKRNRIWAFSRDELYDLFQFEAQLVKMDKDKASDSPLKGVLMTSISNYILKSRNNYNENYICKYLPDYVVEESIRNHQIWIKKIYYLNDEREEKVVPELFKTTDWIEYQWANKIDLSPKRDYYVTSFCKNYSDNKMEKNYGECIYGYKNDRIGDLISPLHKSPYGNISGYMFSQVINFDVLYDKKLAREEINFLCKVIDLFDLSEAEKKSFLEEIMQYWVLSVKDEKWAYENERRYVIFLYKNYEYLDLDRTDEHFLKAKTSLFLFPDFILGNNPRKEILKKNIEAKINAISAKDYMYCKDCLSVNYDDVFTHPDKCPICNSRNYQLVKIKR